MWLFRMWRRTNAGAQRMARGSSTIRALCGTVAALVSINDLADRPPVPLADGERLVLGKHSVQWFDAPHLPHAWECGFLMEERTKTLLCGDLFTQGGADHPRRHRVGHPRPERGVPSGDGLFSTHEKWARDA